MRTAVHRHLGKLVAGAAIAVAATAVMIGVTLPSTAGADDATGDVAAGQAARGEGGRQGQDGTAEVPPAVVKEAPHEGEEGTGDDPLTDDETERVVRLALNPALRSSAEDVDGDRGPQRLGVELAEPEPGELDDPSAPRRADVTFYDYAADSLVTRTVNLDTGEVERTATQRGVQPPPTRAESAEAARLLIADPLGAGLRSDYEDATGKKLTSPDQLLLNSMVYRAVPGAQPAVLDDCGAHRCVRLFPKVKNGPWIDARDFVIDLSTGEVGRLGRD
ncbi:Tat pathway signal sequence domain protein [Streptomyces sp. B93]|uniref:Tat pathway signal sequence domain protein n=1 Tax=Streptomyces sp. B93 TaxID=2824875 RepID=UPI001B36E435|nr:Tat pathway signal sequence domain protein [Streptomyces sp. B93]MBQ1090424.1 Tat pathway signal sequence domain protein [Streptomyces sp. B93]